MITHHLNPLQREFIQKWLADNRCRPSSPAYLKASSALAKIPAGATPPRKSIPYVVAGYEKNEVVPTKLFHAVRDLPAGWAIYNTHDSGNNHRIVNAGVSLLADLWNCWSCKPDDTLPFADTTGGLVAGPRVLAELKANKIDYPQPL